MDLVKQIWKAAFQPKCRQRKQKKQRLRSLVIETVEPRCLMAANSLAIDSTQFDSTRVLAQFRSPVWGAGILGTEVGGATVARQIASDGWYELALDEGEDFDAVLQSIAARTDVLSVTPDFRVRISALPNDSQLAGQWALENNGSAGVLDADIDASQAWDYGTTSSVVVAVIDTGIDYNHVDLAQNIWTNAREVSGNGIDDDRNGYIDDVRGWNFAGNNNNPMDDNGHGTHVAGTIGAVGNNGQGIAGVAWSVKMMALKFLDASGSGSLSDAVEAIDYARLNGAKVINASWGGGGFSSALQSAIQRFQNAGGIFVAAAGNEAANNAVVPSYPANYPLTNVISVAASTGADTLASFSNYGTNVDIAAPGNSILSTIPGNRYTRFSGTSMASPHVAGAFALLWGQNSTLTAAQLIDAVMKNTDNVLRNNTIHGRLNVGKAAASLAGSTAPDTRGPAVTASVWNSTGSSISSVDVTFSEPINVASFNASAVALTGPDGIVAISSIAALATGGTRFRISFPAQTKVGAYQLVIQPTVTDVAGNRMDQDADGQAGETAADQFRTSTTIEATRTFTTLGPVTIADATRTRSTTTTIAINVTDAITIRDLNVDLSLDHTYVSDLRIRLIAPDGTAVTLVNRRGGSRSNMRLFFDDQATSGIASVTGNLSGSFRPELSLSAFNGKNALGRWLLEVTDLATVDSGRLNSVSIQIR